MLVQFCFFGAYFIVSVPAGALIRRVGYQTGAVVGLLIAAAGCALFYPASRSGYGLFLFAFFVLASGITILQVAANPYVTVLGPASTASSRLTLTQAFNSLGTTIAPAVAAGYVSLYWGGALVGRFIGFAVMRYVSPGKSLAFNALAAIALVLAAIFGKGAVAMWAILSVGLFNSIMFPTIFSMALYGLGRHTGQGSGILCMAIVGGAIVPFVQGALADSIGLQTSFFVPALCYGFILYFGLKYANLYRQADAPA
jgi:fucose permease